VYHGKEKYQFIIKRIPAFSIKELEAWIENVKNHHSNP
jgi:hypothetical protein